MCPDLSQHNGQTMVLARIPVRMDLKVCGYMYNGALVTATNRNETGSFTGKRIQLGTHIK